MRALMTALALFAASAVTAQTFTPTEIAGWRHHRFKGEVRYALAQVDGEAALHAVCDGAASGLFLERTIDLAATPILEWRWRVSETFPPGPAENTRSGDDYPARVYAVRKSVIPWRTRAVNYVWASQQPVGATWPNAYASQARMLALRSGPGDGWVTERRNLREDFRRLHGEDVAEIDALAIMTDCDDRGTAAEAWYGPIRFLPE